jgi:DNA topoisomerase-1
MAKKALVIVESPSKAKTIQKYLGRDYIVKASVGHIMDLPKSKMGVDTEKGFKPAYEVIPGKAKIIEDLKKAAARVKEIYLAPDPDREGEAIAWHINQELKTKGTKIHRVLFNAITKQAVKEALENPQKLDGNKFNAQQARRILDRLVGYKISPLLWDKVRRGISAGRVQSVALRLVVDREAEIKVFVPEEYWNLDAVFEKDKIEFSTHLFKIDGNDPELKSKTEMDSLLSSLQGAKFTVGDIEKKERSRKPQPPFITSRLQQESARKLGFSAKKTMTLAQKLYEGVDLGDMGTTGLITYMRTDSVRTEPGAIEAVRAHIKDTYGKGYLPSEPNQYKTKKSAQDAHEAIRPTSLEFNPEKVAPFLEKDAHRLYQLIWNRFVASQMTPAVYDQTAVDVTAVSKLKKEIRFRATGSVIKFAGFTAVYLEGHDESRAAAKESDDADETGALKLPNIKSGDTVAHQSFDPTQHFTQPPPRFTDASLIRELEEKGIGRPSTYASILSNIQDREYVEKRENKYYPSELGTVVTELLVQSFPDILNSEFTAEMEDKLDAIEEGHADWKDTLAKFYKPFEKTLEKAKKHMKNVKKQEVPTDIMCDRCGHHFSIRWGKLGSFLACSHYPECKNTQDFKKDEQGKIVIIPKQYIDKICE